MYIVNVTFFNWSIFLHSSVETHTFFGSNVPTVFLFIPSSIERVALNMTDNVMLAGALSGIVSCVCTYPLNTLQVVRQTSGRSSSVLGIFDYFQIIDL